jgi:hypothetical protein
MIEAGYRQARIVRRAEANKRDERPAFTFRVYPLVLQLHLHPRFDSARLCEHETTRHERNGDLASRAIVVDPIAS